MLLHNSLDAQTLDSYIKVSSYFQRAVHLRYDLGNPDAVDRYMPTVNAAEAIAQIVKGTERNNNQRAHVLYAAYGSGKSLLAVTVAAILERSTQTAQAVNALTERLRDINSEVSKLLGDHGNTGKPRLLPVVLVGDEGDLSVALPRALARAVRNSEVPIELGTRFETALKFIELWREQYPDTYKNFSKLLKSKYSTSVGSFLKNLEGHTQEAYDVFSEIYTVLSAGAVFDPFNGQPVERLFENTARELSTYGYDGVAVIWDEFGRYLEARAAKAFSNEAALLQSFAEACNYSRDCQLHLILFTHKELQSYASTLPKTFQQEWSRIEGRFSRHDITSDIQTAYQLIANAFAVEQTEQTYQIWQHIDLQRLVNETLDSRIFDLLGPDDIRNLIAKTWPLHPLTVFALARLSNRVAQNERTMFTFLTADERYAFLPSLANLPIDAEDPFLRPGTLWDYFEAQIRDDVGINGAHKTWSGVIHALGKVAREDRFTEEIVKTLGVLMITSDTGIRPTTDLLCWALGAESDDERAAVVQSLENLRRRKVVIHRQIDGYWNFTSGSDIDFENRLADILERINPNPTQLRRMLEKLFPAPFILARRYNQDFEMTRFYYGLYRWPQELEQFPWDAQLEQLSNPDGIVVYVLATDELGIGQAQLNAPNSNRVVLAIPQEPLISLEHLLRELFGLQELNNDPLLKGQEDKERIQRELDWLIEDAQERLRNVINILIDSRSGQVVWRTRDRSERITTPGQATRFVSELCSEVFSSTPVINSEGINKRAPTMQQLRASEKVIDSMFGQPLTDQLGMTGYGPEVLICRTLLMTTGILRQERDQWIVGRPNDYALANIWDLIDEYLEKCQLSGAQSLKTLIDELTAPPFGLRQGIIPVLFAATLHRRLRATTIRRDQRAMYPINGALLTEMVFTPSDFTIEIGEWTEKLDWLWNALESRFSGYTLEGERNQDPLAVLRIAMLRWLQSLPRFCRDTMQLEPSAIAFRDLIRKAQIEPALVILHDLPALVDVNNANSQPELEGTLDHLMSAISASYLELQTRLDIHALKAFSINKKGRHASNGLKAMREWLNRVELETGQPIADFRFSSPTTQAFVDSIATFSENDTQYWEHMSQSLTGLHLRDWVDKSEEKFCAILIDARSEIEAETQALLEDSDSTISISVQLPGNDAKDFRFRNSALSQHGRSLLQNLKSTIDIAGRPLSVDERRRIAVDLMLRYVMGENSDE